MGQEIVYCAKCGNRIKESDFKAKNAFAISNRNWCLECIQRMLPSLSEAGRARMQELISRESEPAKAPEPEQEPAEPQVAPKFGTSKILKVKPTIMRRPPRDGHPAADRGELRSSGGGKTGLIVGGAVVAVAAVIAAVVLMGGGSSKGPGGSSREAPGSISPREPVAVAPSPSIGDEPSNSGGRPTPVGRATPEEIRARVGVLIAEASGDSNQPPGPILKRMRDLMWEADLYPDMVKALNEAMAPFQKKLKEEVDVAAAAVGKESEALAAQSKYGEAFVLLDERKRARPEPEWTSAIDKLILDLRGRVDKEWEELERRAKQEFDPRAARTILEPVRGWGIETYARRAEALLKNLETAAAPAPPVPSPGPKPEREPDPTPSPGAKPVPPANEGEAYESLWTQVAEHALRREYDSALKAVGAHEGTFVDAGTRRRALEDQRAVTLAKEMFDQAIEFLASGAGGLDVTLRVVDPMGRKRSVRGKVVRASTSRVELQGGGQSTEFVELYEVEADSLYMVHRARKSKDEADAERAAYFFIFEGEPKAGRKAAGKSEEKIPARLWEYAEAFAERLREERKAASPDRDAAKREMEARELFYKAERAYRNIDQVALAVFDFKDVLSKYGDTEFVRRNRAQIEARADGGKEWLVRASDIKAASPLWELKLLPGAPLDKVWLAKSDSTPNNYRQGWIEVSFYTAPGATYRIYVLAYGCCQETLKFFYQGNGVVGTGGQSAEIGAQTSMVAPAPTSLPATHGHGGGQHKWQWILLTQGYTSGGGGVKKFRIMTEIGDVGIGYALATSTRTAPPRNSEELRQLEMGR
jgi:tetratricopeptide (TPR) repeat protein